MAIWWTDRAAETMAFARPASFAAGHRGQGLRCGQGAIVVPDSPGLAARAGIAHRMLGQTRCPRHKLAAGADQGRRVPAPHRPAAEGGQFSFYLHLDGWEPRVRSNTVAKVGVWYHLLAGWDGKEIWIDVNGQRASAAAVRGPGCVR